MSAPTPAAGPVGLGIDYDGRRFRPVGHGAPDGTVPDATVPDATGPDGDRPGGTVATYRQRDDLLWAEFEGGSTRRGALCGVRQNDGRLEFTYSMVLDTGDVISGRCVSVPEILADGRIRLHETWERFAPHAARGTSQIEEVEPD